MLLRDLYKKFQPIAATVKNDANAVNNFVQNKNRAFSNAIQANVTPQVNQVGYNKPFKDAKVENTLRAGYNGLVRPIVNSGLRLGIGTAQDVGKVIGNRIQGHQTDYNTLVSPLSRASALVSKNTISNTPRTASETLRVAGQTGEDVLNLATLGKAGEIANVGEQGFKAVVKQGIKSGAKFGAGYGTATGIQKGNNVKEQLINAGKEAVTNAIGGAVIGGTLAGGGYGAKVGTKMLKSGIKNTVADLSVSKLINKPINNFTEELQSNGAVVRRYRTDLETIDVPNSQLRSVVRGDKVKTNDYKAPEGSSLVVRNKNTGQIESIIPDNQAMTPHIQSWAFKSGKINLGAELPTGRNTSEMPTSPNIEPKGKLKVSKSNTPIETPAGIPQNSSELSSNLPYDANITQQNNLVNGTRDILNGSQTKERGFVTSIKGSKNTPEQLKSIIEGTYIPKTAQELRTQAKNLIRTDINTAEQVAVNPQNDVHIQIGNELLNHYNATGQFQKANELSLRMAESGTEFGRAVQAFSNYDKTTPEGALRFAQSTVQKYNRENPTAKLKITDAQVENIFAKAKQVQAMAEGRDRNIASQQLMDEVNKLIPSSIADKAITVWKAGLLTSPRTTLRNLAGNTVHGVAEIAKDPFATLADSLMALKTGTRTKTFTVNGTLSGALKGGQAALDTMKLGFDPEESIQKYDVKKINWGTNPVGKTLGKYTDFVFNFMGAQDKPFYHSAFARSLYDQAGAEAINAGQKGNKAFIENLVKNPTENMLKTATQDASVATFKDKNQLGQMINAWKQKSGKFKPAMDIIAPFTGVPSSIAGQIVQYSPIGLVKGSINAGRVLAGRVPELQRQAAQEIGRGVIGTGLAGLGSYLMSKGVMTGSPKDAKEANQWALEGKQANSVMVNGKWRSINSIGPEMLVSLAGAKAQEQFSSPDNKNTTSKLSATGAQIGKDFMSQTFLSGVQQPLNAISDPARYAGTYTSSQLASVVPNIVKDASKAFDPNQRETTNSTAGQLQSSVPGWRNKLLPKRDVLGNVMKQEPTGLNAFVDLFNSKTPVKNPVVNELSRLNIVGESATPSKLSADQTVYGNKTKLTPSQLDQLEQQSGGLASTLLNQIVSDPNYKKLSDQEKSKTISNAISDVRDSSKKTLVSGGVVDPNSITGKYKIQLQKDQFSNSGKNIQTIDGNVYRKDKTGNVTVQSQLSYDSDLLDAKLTRAKMHNNLKEWGNLADQQLSNLLEQQKDPSLDELEKMKIQKKIDDLTELAQKYGEQGGFKKGSKPKFKYEKITPRKSPIVKRARKKLSLPKPKKITNIFA